MATATFAQHVIDSNETLDQCVDAFLRAYLPHNAVIPHPARVF